MKECYAREGVNHVTECRDIADKYLEAAKVDFIVCCFGSATPWHVIPDP